MTQRPRRESAAPEAKPGLDQRSEALRQVLPQILADFQPEISSMVDEVVVSVKPEQVPDVCRITKEAPELDMDYLRCLCTVDFEDRLEVVYHLFSLTKRHKLTLLTSVSPEDPKVPTVTNVWRAADWFEREAHDLFGVEFPGHPNLAPLLLYEGFEGYPGRKSFPFHDYDEW